MKWEQSKVRTLVLAPMLVISYYTLEGLFSMDGLAVEMSKDTACEFFFSAVRWALDLLHAKLMFYRWVISATLWHLGFDTALGLVMLSPVIVVICHLHHESQSWRWAGWLLVLSLVLSLSTSPPSVFPCLDFSLLHPSWSSLSPSAQGVRLVCHGLFPITLLTLWPLWWLCWGLGVRPSLVAWESFISRSFHCFIPIQSVVCLFPPYWRFPKKLYLFCGFLDPRNSSLLYLKFYLWFLFLLFTVKPTIALK